MSNGKTRKYERKTKINFNYDAPIRLFCVFITFNLYKINSIAYLDYRSKSFYKYKIQNRQKSNYKPTQ